MTAGNMRTIHKIGALVALVVPLALAGPVATASAAAPAAVLKGCSKIKVDKDRKGVTGYCGKSAHAKTYWVWMWCATNNGTGKTKIKNGPMTKVGKKSHIRCQKGRSLWKHSGNSNYGTH
ncbi:hypothetical protein NE236_08240 [Actinoallomurus purpureus]|uniref:hypothetical protein n=1 Tax=Actinoallomurus purpureus TaxID=478114 RepID=UPI00209306B4|nr:hypothetical protein [Actinoallomurus purpureus]MCO6004969.1 hypothetical protein [Actinoallomurus purpureus]